jgi:mannose-6-phosphate isomerase-like protein (cupin superfamily)
MDYAPSPRPTFEGPAHIPWANVTRHLWGDATSGEVADWIYVSSDCIHQIVFGLAPGGAFRHSEQYRTVFAADEVLYVLSGTMVIANPETGEVHRAGPGEAAFFQRDTWHHVFNPSGEALRVLELFAPPPATGSSGAYSRTRPYLTDARYGRPEAMASWPASAPERRAADTIHLVRPEDRLWSLQGQDQQVLIGTIASTEQLTVAHIEILPGRATEAVAHAGDTSLYVLSGQLNIEIDGGASPRWSELGGRDGFYLPAGTSHRFRNFSDQPVEAIVAVAPGIRSW